MAYIFVVCLMLLLDNNYRIIYLDCSIMSSHRRISSSPAKFFLKGGDGGRLISFANSRSGDKALALLLLQSID